MLQIIMSEKINMAITAEKTKINQIVSKISLIVIFVYLRSTYTLPHLVDSCSLFKDVD